MNNVKVINSVTGQYWQITVNGRIVEGFAKRGHGAAKKSQVEAIAQTYREKV
jgi:ribosomal protein L35